MAETLTGWPRAEARQAGGGGATPARREDREPIENPLARALRDRVVSRHEDHTLLVSRSGTEVPVEHSASPVRDDAGEVRGAILVFRDISKRRQLEEQATHAQKMDAVGRLAGGVAGDFNNVLTVITGYAELLRAEFPSTSPIRRFVDEIIYAGERAAALTRHLLAFSRGATAQPRVLDLNQLIYRHGADAAPPAGAEYRADPADQSRLRTREGRSRADGAGDRQSRDQFARRHAAAAANW